MQSRKHHSCRTWLFRAARGLFFLDTASIAVFHISISKSSKFQSINDAHHDFLLNVTQWSSQGPSTLQQQHANYAAPRRLCLNAPHHAENPTLPLPHHTDHEAQVSSSVAVTALLKAAILVLHRLCSIVMMAWPPQTARPPQTAPHYANYAVTTPTIVTCKQIVSVSFIKSRSGIELQCAPLLNLNPKP